MIEYLYQPKRLSHYIVASTRVINDNFLLKDAIFIALGEKQIVSHNSQHLHVFG